MKSFLRRFSLEAAETQVAETEITLYAKITAPEGLSAAESYEHHVQLEARLGEENFCRVRQTTAGNEKAYVYTFKLRNENHSAPVDSRQEFNLPVDAAYFDAFFKAADSCQEKTRYFFKSQSITLTVGEGNETREISVPEVIYEVDVFKKPGTDGNSIWCKIDIEVDRILTFLEHNHPELANVKLVIKISHLPFKPVESFIGKDATPEQKALLDKLYQTEFKEDLVKTRLLEHVKTIGE